MSDREPSLARTRSEASPTVNDKSPVAARSSQSPSRNGRRHRHSYSRSRSHSRSRKMSYRGHYRSRSRSRSPRRYKSRYSRSRSRSGSAKGGRYGYSDRRREYYRSHSRSPMSNRRRHVGNRQPRPNRCLGIFGLSLRTTERDLREIFSRFGPLDELTIVVDAQTGRSRGFSFVYFTSLEDAKAAKEQCTGMEIDGKRIRVDYSITQRAHTPTPGIYMGKPTYSGYRGGGYRRSPSPYYSRSGRRGRHDRSRSRSYSPRRY